VTATAPFFNSSKGGASIVFFAGHSSSGHLIHSFLSFFLFILPVGLQQQHIFTTHFIRYLLYARINDYR
jgi:hypothetical protein